MKTRHLIPTLLVLGAALMAATMASATVFVDPTAPGSQDGSSWVNAFHTLQPAINASAAGGGDVWVAGGPAGSPIVYGENRAESWGNPASVTGSLVMKDNVAMYGGFEGYRSGAGKQETALNQRALALNVAVISGATSRGGSAAYHVVVFGRNGMPTFGATLDGFTITGGNAAGVSGDYHTWRGGGIYNWGSQPNIQNCVIIGNTAAVSGGGIANETGAGQEANASIANCVVVNNTAGRAADDYLAGNPVPVRGGGGIFNDMATPNLWHVTVLSNAIGNPAYTTFGAASGGVYTWDHNLALVSSIVWSNGTSGQLDQPAGGSSVYAISYSDVEGGAPGTGNINVNPNLAGDYSPNAGSPVINTAQPGLNPPVDCRLVTRPVGAVADMGAAEFTANGPNAVCKAYTVVLDGSGAGSLTAADINNGSTAEAGILSLAAGQTSFDCGDLGANTVSLTVTDMLGRTASCDAAVTVEDNEDPVITVCATDQSIDMDAACAALVPDFTAGVTATDNCGATISQSPVAGGAAVLGDTTITITATDAAGNTDTCTATLTVNDVTDPVINACAPDQVIGSDVNCQAQVPDFTATIDAVDTCDATPTVTQSPVAGTVVGLGDTTVTITVADDAGNSATCDATLTVNATPPAAPALAAISPDTGASATDFITSGTDFQLLGTCPVGVVLNVRLGLAPGVYIQNYDDIPTAGGNFLIPLNGVAPFTYYMQFQSENACGTQGAWSTEYSVTIDTAVPTITECAPAQTVEADDVTCLGTIPDLTGGVVATDNVPGTLTVTQSPLAGSTAAIGDTTVTLTVADVAGNTATCDTIVTVADTPPAAPALVAMNPDTGASPTDFITNATTFQLLGTCPADVTLNAQIGLAPGVYIQNYSDLPTVGGQFLIPLNGVAPFTYYMHFQVKNNCGTLSDWSTEYAVTVDTTLPTIDTCAADQTVAADATCTEGIVPDFTAGVVATDNVPGTLTVAQSPLAGTTAPLGDTTVTITVTDVAGNEATCTATLTVADQTGPVFSVCAADQQLVPGPGCTGIVPDMQAEPVAADACGGNVVITQSPAPGTSFTGAVTVTFTAEDERGNTSTCEATVSLVDTEDPVAVCQDITIGLSDGVLEGSDIDGGSTDNCIVDELLVDGVESITYTCADLGDHTVTLTVLDANGNSATCTATVTVEDDVEPVVTLVGDAAVVLDNGDTYTELGATAEDNCDGTLTPVTGGDTVNDRVPGVYTVTYTATDADGNVGTATRTVTVQRVACALVVEAVASEVSALPEETVTLEVALGAANCAIGDVHYAWKKDDGSKALVDVPGSADAPTLVFPSVAVSDSGVYQCEVSDDMYAVLSPEITLTVDPGVPAAGIAGLGLAALAAALTGARALRRRK